MTHGKNICNQLKEVRKRIAEENDIPLEIEECRYKGECRGTCPRCEAEVRYLENALADRLRLGKVATVAGLALGLATTTVQAAECNPAIPSKVPPIVKESVHVADSITIKGTVVDSKTNEPLPFVNVIVKKDGKMVTGCSTDFDGNFSITVSEGRYDIETSYIGYARYIQTDVLLTRDTTFATIKLSDSDNVFPVTIGIITDEDIHPVIEIDPNGASQYLEKDGVKVIVR